MVDVHPARPAIRAPAVIASREAGCSYPRPSLGSGCSTEGLSCGYGAWMCDFDVKCF